MEKAVAFPEDPWYSSTEATTMSNNLAFLWVNNTFNVLQSVIIVTRQMKQGMTRLRFLIVWASLTKL